ncbi:MAG: hypothetical protein JWM08_1779 [Candidatus Angelobacter sp.]|jgi:hypothetical protein|nr:hypothetical protein [Candidatus Angelobacter sp.]
MGWLSSILRVLAPIAVEHGGQVLRDSLKSRAAQGHASAEASSSPDPVQLLAADVDQIKGYVLQLKSDLETLNNVAAGREERLRRWLLGLLVWNILMTLGLVVLALIALRH